MRIKFLLNDTYIDNHHQRWHSRALSSIARYCAIHNHKLEIISNNHYMIKNSILSDLGKTSALLRKTIRYYDAVKSDFDYFIFIDLDTLVLDPQRNVLDLIDPQKTYMAEFIILEENVKANKDIWKQSKFKILEAFSGRENETMLDPDTGFSGVNKKFCSDFLDFLSDKDLDVSSKSGLENILQLEQEIIKRGVETAGHIISDEHLMALFLFDKQPRLFCPKNNKFCSRTYDLKMESPDRPYHGHQSIDRMLAADCVFHHMISGIKTDPIFKVFEK